MNPEWKGTVTKIYNLNGYKLNAMEILDNTGKYYAVNMEFWHLEGRKK